MDDCKLSDKKCTPCTGKTPRFTQAEIDAYLPLVPEWRYYVNDAGDKIQKTFSFTNFITAMVFINKMADVAENQEHPHHPDFRLYNYRHVEVSLTTHAIRGLSENDFILAAKIDIIVMA